ncbi:hypothetical protein BX070DRAFT_100543 [Coemansia spiralis]|nr:hypothetical protein BX070DRAFT_100543 [Coemansia spiralis]
MQKHLLFSLYAHLFWLNGHHGVFSLYKKYDTVLLSSPHPYLYFSFALSPHFAGICLLSYYLPSLNRDCQHIASWLPFSDFAVFF